MHAHIYMHLCTYPFSYTVHHVSCILLSLVNHTCCRILHPNASYSNFRIFYDLKNSFEPFAVNLQSCSGSPKQVLICLWSLQMFLFWIFYINGIIHYKVFFVWLLSLSKKSFRFIHVVSCISNWLCFPSYST